jgi:predicted transglutaminase-like cysteine proteinase
MILEWKRDALIRKMPSLALSIVMIKWPDGSSHGMTGIDVDQGRWIRDSGVEVFNGMDT